jgi:ketosteroid isomerase-like protein
MTTKASRTADEEQIRQLIDSWRKALCAKNVDGLMSHYLPDVLLYDLAPPLVHRGAEMYRKSWESGCPRSRVLLAMRSTT